MTHYILINGPPKSGRSTLAQALHKRLKNSIRAELHAPLKHLFCSGLGMGWQALNNDKPKAILNGRSAVDSLRQLRLHLRGLYGPDVLGKWLVFRILGMVPVPDIVIVDDVLFPDDLEVFESNTLVRVIKGEENNFVPISNPGYTVINGSGLEYLHRRADQIVGGLNNAG